MTGAAKSVGGVWVPVVGAEQPIACWRVGAERLRRNPKPGQVIKPSPGSEHLLNLETAYVRFFESHEWIS